MENRKLSRLAESRTNEMLKQYNMEYVSPLALPHGAAREGYMYCWANKDMPHQVEGLMRMGWEIVPSDRSPSYAIDPFKQYDNYAPYLWYKDAILMEIPEILGMRLKAATQSLADKAMYSIQGHVSTDTSMHGGVMRGINSF
jgi:hypothetical protein